MKKTASLLGASISAIILILTLNTTVSYTPRGNGEPGLGYSIKYDPAASTDAAVKLINHILAYGLGVLTNPQSLRLSSKKEDKENGD